MKLRNLKIKDAPLMLEWMHDEALVRFFSTNFKDKALRDCEAFIQAAAEDESNRNWAICTDEDEYLGTVSLKHIDLKNGNGEYAIAMRRCALGTGASHYGTQEVLRIAFEEMGLNRVYLNVLEDNVRANKFYEKVGFIYEGTFAEHLYVNGKFRNLKWFALTKTDYLARKAK
jgi:diamine N-acetyltransferase